MQKLHFLDISLASREAAVKLSTSKASHTQRKKEIERDVPRGGDTGVPVPVFSVSPPPEVPCRYHHLPTYTHRIFEIL
jgi:hypothetical protein